MFIEQLYTNCLSEAAYFISSDGEAAVIDPLRDIEKYLTMAKEQNVKIKYIFETHFHADFVSGHLDLAKATGGEIVYGPNTDTQFSIHKAKDGEEFKIGKLSITALHTPGHTVESTCYLLKNENGKPHCIFTGDTLFVGDVGRPDLFSGNLSKEELASMMYDSLQNKIMPLADDIIVYPAHGPGSACGKNLGKETFTTIGLQKQTNYALQPQTKEEFILSVTSGLNAPPAYFPLNAAINKNGYDPLEEIKTKGLKALNIEKFRQAITDGATILDTRSAHVFTTGFVPQSISIGLEGRFAEWAGTLLPLDEKLILVAEKGKEEESLIRLARVGFNNVIGYLEGGFEAWIHAGETHDMIIDIEADELAMDIPHDKKLEVLDVRKELEFDLGHVQGATNLPLDEMRDLVNVANLDDHHNFYVHCAGGYRSVIAASIMKKHGLERVKNVLGGYAAIKKLDNITLVESKTILN